MNQKNIKRLTIDYFLITIFTITVISNFIYLMNGYKPMSQWTEGEHGELKDTYVFWVINGMILFLFITCYSLEIKNLNTTFFKKKEIDEFEITPRNGWKKLESPYDVPHSGDFFGFNENWKGRGSSSTGIRVFTDGRIGLDRLVDDARPTHVKEIIKTPFQK